MMYVSIAEEYYTKKGIEKGMIEGEIKGKIEGKFEVARRMLDRKMPISDIADITGLDEKDLLSL
jgi:predicted transposase/invertase (TIGR01784 family)